MCSNEENKLEVLRLAALDSLCSIPIDPVQHLPSKQNNGCNNEVIREVIRESTKSLLFY